MADSRSRASGLSARARRSALLLPLAGALLLAGCAANTAVPAEDPLRAALRERGLDPEAILAPFALDDDLRAWAHEAVPRGTPREDRPVKLLAALMAEDGLSLVYQSGYTATVREVFETRRANCLAFTHTFIAMARELGAPAGFLKIDDIRSYTQEGDLVVSSGHMTVGSGTGESFRILEFAGLDVDYHQAYPVSDLEAVALFYSNRGGEALRALDNARAVLWLETTVQILPELLDGWVNLGVARRRLGDEAGAEAAYRRALEIDPGTSTAYQNLAALYAIQGRRDLAREILVLADRRDNRNPYTYLDLGDLSLRQGDHTAAERFYRRALRLDPKLPEAHVALGLWATEAGRLSLAKRSLRKARRIDPENHRADHLEQRLALVASH